jgi:biopolymer transport protein ExbB
MMVMDYLLNAYEYFRPGGWVMVLLVIVSFWMWGLVFERLVSFWSMDRQDIDLKGALASLKKKTAIRNTTGICACLVSGFKLVRTGDSSLDQRFLEQYALMQKPRIRRCLSTITILAATAPLLGLLGTVTGMVTTFDVIAAFGSGNAKALSGGISKALVTTQCGLIVGIPGLFMSRMLTRRAQAIERRLTETVIALKRAL